METELPIRGVIYVQLLAIIMSQLLVSLNSFFKTAELFIGTGKPLQRFTSVSTFARCKCEHKEEEQDFITIVTGQTRREMCRSICKLYSKTWSKTQARSKHQQTGITQARQRVILGQAWVFDRRTISRGLEERGSQNNMSNNPTRYNQSPNGETKGKSRKHGKETKHDKTEKTTKRVPYRS